MTTIMTIRRELSANEIAYINTALERFAVSGTIPGGSVNPAHGLTPYVVPATPGTPAYVAVLEDNISVNARGILYDTASDASDRAWQLRIAARDRAIERHRARQ